MAKNFTQLVLKWNSHWRYDYWYRQKYNIAFNSEQHRSLNQIDIKFDYLEKQIAEFQQQQYEQLLKDEEEYKKTGRWLKKRKVDEKKEQDLLNHITLSDID